MRAALARMLGLSGDQLWAFSIHSAQLAHVRVADECAMLESFLQG